MFMLYKKLYQNVLMAFFVICLSGCTQKQPGPHQMTSINIVDRNGMSETISSKDRLESYQNVDFLQSQPYQKVLRIFGRGSDGSLRSCITSYHPNGQPRQYLEALNGRACGMYREWHSNGQLKLESKVIGGIADINTAAEESWLFDGSSRAWDEDGHLMVEIPYSKGHLEGVATYYHPSGAISKTVPYLRHQLHGTVKIYNENENLLQSAEYCEGIKEGMSRRYWPDNKLACEESFAKGKLLEGSYFDEAGVQISQVHQENGWRAVFGLDGGYQLQEYRNGVQEGCVKIFDKNERLMRSYFLKDGVKHGEELVYSVGESCKENNQEPPRPLLSISWLAGSIQGLVKTWYPNGKLESQREMSLNRKNGMFTAWYKSGSIMLLEEYHQDNLVSGEYFRKGERFPVSKVVNGKGMATLFDADGNFLRKVNYRNGRVVE